MYNRYVPQPDGSYRKNRVQEPRWQEPSRPPVQHKPKPTPPKQAPCPPEKPPECPVPAPPEPSCHKQPPCRQDNITGFFKQLLPKDLETADLLIIILLLLMAGDCEEDRNNALLTLALYFFM